MGQRVPPDPLTGYARSSITRIPVLASVAREEQVGYVDRVEEEIMDRKRQVCGGVSVEG